MKNTAVQTIPIGKARLMCVLIHKGIEGIGK